MKTSLLSAVLAIAALIVMLGGAVNAATNLNSSRSNIYKPIGNPGDIAACRALKGSVVVRKAKEVCINPKLPSGWAQKQLPSCETCNRLCPGVCFMHVEGGCICFYDPLRTGG
jgi:hypothetical protein